MTKRLNSGSSPLKEQKYKMHFAKLETKKRKQAVERARRKQGWDDNSEWQHKKPILMKKLKAAARLRRLNNEL